MKNLILLLILCFTGLSLQSQDLLRPAILQENIVPNVNETNPALENNNPAFLGSLEETLNATFDSMFVLSGEIGFSAAMHLPDGTVWAKAAGTNSGGMEETTLTTSDPIGMGSITKSFTSVVILQLEEEGLLSIEDPISNYLDTINNVNPNITIKQMLNHTSGIFNYTNHVDFATVVFGQLTHFFEPEDMFQFIGSSDFPAGTNWNYSNTNYLLAGLIIEAVTENSYHDEVRNRVINPLELQDTWLMPYEEAPNLPIAHLWVDISGDNVQDDYHAAFPNIDGFFSAAWSAGAIVTTPSELAVYIKNLFNGTLLSEAALEKLQTLVPLGANAGYGLGVVRLNHPTLDKISWGHNGNILYQSEAQYFPELDLSVVIQTNDAGPSPNPSVNIIEVYLALVQAYCNYSPPSSIADLSIIEKLEISPNPVKDELKIHHATGQFKIVDMYGEVVRQGQVVENQSIFVATLPVGVYILTVEGDDENWLGKIVKR